ncbi:MAG TPA: response regulator transcription factor [Verrucomicrobiales bacterium]|nr:response regulator transcription factor [Verrucomicrobiales bacterium]
MKILIVEDYGPLRLAIAQSLVENGYAVDHTADGAEALWMLQNNAYAVAVLDIMLPAVSGLDLLGCIRREGKDTAVLLITARDGIEDRVNGLDAGADDYLVKPFALDELLARVRVLTRRSYGLRDPVVKVADLEVDTARRTARRGGTPLSLTAKEYALLELLALRAGHVVRRSDIWEQLYDFADEAESNVVDVFIAYLRRKVEGPERPRLIHTRRGEGYVLESRE